MPKKQKFKVGDVIYITKAKYVPDSVGKLAMVYYIEDESLWFCFNEELRHIALDVKDKKYTYNFDNKDSAIRKATKDEEDKYHLERFANA